ncbi:hypothetical protein EI77_01611 [Prosthecobacter fusiformis]|uniref:Uncharacterized protein n=1 Tax=Prosthecobacter fusiformis TaxID=48464 RepID=A0A4V3FG37_9BACT|nr:hypothetical protein EI77_01611 [Prosthecobacter fusiformis]
MTRILRLLFLFTFKAIESGLIILGTLKVAELFEIKNPIFYQAGVFFALFTLLLPHYMHHDSILPGRKRNKKEELNK